MWNFEYAIVGACISVVVFVGLLQSLICVALKFMGAIDWPWLAVFAPVLLIVAGFVLFAAASLIAGIAVRVLK